MTVLDGFSERVAFRDATWANVPTSPGVYVIFDLDEVVYVGMTRGSLRNRLRDHARGQIVNMFAQYLFLARVQFLPPDRIVHPLQAQSACQKYISERCSFQWKATIDASDASNLERRLRTALKPALNP